MSTRNAFHQYFEQDVFNTIDRYAICFAVNSIENYRNLLTLENNIKKYKPVFKYEYFDDKFLDRTYYNRSMLVKIDDFSCQPCLSLDRKNHIELILEVY